MSYYCFMTRGHATKADELLGTISLRDDAIACEFGTTIVRDLIREAPSEHAGWTLEIANRERSFASIPFRLDAIGD